MLDLSSIADHLARFHGKPDAPAITDPFHQILWVQVAYLVDDQKRARAFEQLRSRVGLNPVDILAADEALLEEITTLGGKTAAVKRASRMRESAEHVQTEWGGDLSRALTLPLKQATKAMAWFPMIGRPGAETILLFAGAHPVLALESNGLRVLIRLGYAESGLSYDKTYRHVRAATLPDEQPNSAWLTELHLLLRTHGKVTCRQSGPDCGVCPLEAECPFGRIG